MPCIQQHLPKKIWQDDAVINLILLTNTMKSIIKIFAPVTLAACLVACNGRTPVEADYAVVPLPNKMECQQDAAPFVLNKATRIYYPKDNAQMKRNAEFLAQYVEELTGYKLEITDEAPAAGGILLEVDKTISSESEEAYNLIVADNIRIAGKSEAGVFYGIQTLRKAIPADAHAAEVVLPAVTIEDAPRFGYRGMMLDVSRHFFTPDEVKRYIDILALHNINRLHWHLSDDQGWRLEIKKYPRLTEIGSQREETVIGRNSGKYDGKPYGGYYTQEQIKDIVAYAAERYVTIIPEIDLPGHQQAALAAYPDFGCTGGPYKVWTQWGISDNVICAGNDQAMTFLEDVLTEVTELFPSEYIHVGGDECPKTRWKDCPKCQARISSERIKGDDKHSAEEYLQSYVISRMEKHLESLGRHIIGWDEILEGGLAPNATVMSWRGMGGGIEAAKQKHNVIMTPNSYVYFDYYQSTDTENEPMAIGGYVPVERVYSLEPTAGIPEENKHYVIGAQANLWTEYIPNFKQVEYMVMPRMAALAEVQWTAPEKKNYADFLQRVTRTMEHYDVLGYNYAKHLLDIHATLEPDPEAGALVVKFKALGRGDIYYTTDGTEPTEKSARYDSLQPVQIKNDAEIKAVVIRPSGARSRIFTEKVSFSKSAMKSIVLKQNPHGGYTFNGAAVLADGLRGSENYKTGRWLGFQGNDLEAVIDLQEATEFEKLSFCANVVKGDWIMGPRGVRVRISDDGKNFKEIFTEDIPSLAQTDKDGLHPYEFELGKQKARYVEVLIKSDTLPEWHGGAGSPAFIFVDELVLE